MKKIAVLGAAGRMGRAVCEGVSAASDMEIVARMDLDSKIENSTLNGAEVAIDFTTPTAAEANVLACLKAGTDIVVGTSGWTEAATARVEAQMAGAGRVLVVPNFSISAVLTMRFAAAAASYFESVEVVELHHPKKIDAPSGTAAHTATQIAQVRRAAGLPDSPDATTLDPDGARGAVIDGVHVHAVRLRGLMAHEEVLLGNPGETLTIRTDTFDTSSYMPGILLAARKINQLPVGKVSLGLDTVLD